MNRSPPSGTVSLPPRCFLVVAVALQRSGDLTSTLLPGKAPVVRESTQLKRTVESMSKGHSAERPIIRQGHVSEREGRRAHVIVGKNSGAVTTSRSPIDSAVNTPPVPLSDSRVRMTPHAALRQPQLPVGPMRVERQLSRAAAYIQERINRRSPPCEEFGCRAPRGPPDKAKADPGAPQQPANVVAKEAGASALRLLALLPQLGVVALSALVVMPSAAHDIVG
ncbi:hypothetical protein AX14_010135 [Amanita brunnescens Koide BX004]|nr:hypothetical protein AX14_010135 [Amanita brunnescens Koide BX004]